MDEGDAPVALAVGVPDQDIGAHHVVGHHRDPAIEDMVDGDHRQTGVNQLQHLGVLKVHTGDDRAVYPPVAAVLQISGGPAAHIAVDKGDVVAVGLRLHLEAVQHGGEVLMGQAAAALVHKEHADVVGAVGFQSPGGGVGQVSHLIGDPADALPGLRADVLLAVESLAYRGDRHIAAQRDILHRDHRHPLPPWRFVLCVNFAGR